jgi:hypothetical protein
MQRVQKRRTFVDLLLPKRNSKYHPNCALGEDIGAKKCVMPSGFDVDCPEMERQCDG